MYLRAVKGQKAGAMSYETSTIEQLTIRNDREEARVVISALKEYLGNLFACRGMETLELRELRLKVGRNTETIEDEDGGFGYEIDVPEEVDELLEKMEKSKDITLYADYTHIGSNHTDYGYGFFSNYLKDGAQEYVSYKCIESYDVEPDVIAYQFGMRDGEPVNGLASKQDKLSIVKQVESWYDSGFKVEVTVPSESKKCEKIEELLTDFMDSYDGEDFDSYDAEEYTVYEMSFTLIIEGDQVREAAKDLTKIAKETAAAGGEFKLRAAFIPEDEASFCALWLEYENGKVVPKAVNLNRK